MMNAPRKKLAPLAERMRPATLDDVIGPQHILGEGKPANAYINPQGRKMFVQIFVPVGWNYV